MSIFQRQVKSISMTYGGTKNAHIKWVNNPDEGWNSSVQNVILDIENGWRYFVRTRGLPDADLSIVKQDEGDRRTWYVCTDPDGLGYNNLLMLPGGIAGTGALNAMARAMLNRE
jgi:hypothetical protein